jgi:hypothetical protein
LAPPEPAQDAEMMPEGIIEPVTAGSIEAAPEES